MHAPRACLDYYSMGAEVRGQLVWSQTQVVKVPKIVTNYFFFTACLVILLITPS